MAKKSGLFSWFKKEQPKPAPQEPEQVVEESQVERTILIFSRASPYIELAISLHPVSYFCGQS